MKTAMETDSSPSAELFAQTEQAWYCVRTQLKHEHIAEAHLRQIPGVEAFYPRIELWRSTRRGPVRARESLFPNYLFARFDLEALLERVSFTAGVKTVLRFGCLTPEVPATVIADLQMDLTSLDGKELTDHLSEGEEVEITVGAFAGTKGSVESVLPGNQRVRILLDILGRSVHAELRLDQLLFNRRNAAEIAFTAVESCGKPIHCETAST